jgi:hypothetical protein
MIDHVFCTVVTRSHLRYAVALGSQLKQLHPETSLRVLLIDPPGDIRSLNDLAVELVPLSEVRIPEVDEMKIYFTAFELSNALKPFLIAHLLDAGFRKVIYLDSDVLVVGRFDQLISVLDRANFVLTPHVLTPSLNNTQFPTNVLVADRGIYNGGLWGMREHKNSRAALAWLMDVLPAAGFSDVARGMFVDQKVLPLAADLFSIGFEVLRAQGYNIAHWNLQERNVRKDGPRYFVDREPVTFFHLSGFREDHPDTFSIYSERPDCDTMPVLNDIIADYLRSLPSDERLSAGGGYAFDSYNGRGLTQGLRRHYFAKRTFAGYGSARVWAAVRSILRGVKSLVTS